MSKEYNNANITASAINNATGNAWSYVGERNWYFLSIIYFASTIYNKTLTVVRIVTIQNKQISEISGFRKMSASDIPNTIIGVIFPDNL